VALDFDAVDRQAALLEFGVQLERKRRALLAVLP